VEAAADCVCAPRLGERHLNENPNGIVWEESFNLKLSGNEVILHECFIITDQDHAV
jgi:hypothetical protein